jgi:E3 ubiquitin-protein ligase SIAH1
MNTLCDDLLKELECPVCTEYMLPPIAMCESGHNICSNCRPNLVKCPSCRQPFLNLRNRAFEKLSLMADHPCCYKSYGCQLVFKADMKTDHEILCPYRPYTCPLLRDDQIKCQWSGILKNLKKHIKKTHKDRLTDIKSGKHVCIRRYKENHKYTRIILAYEEMFYEQFEVIDNTFYFVIQHIGPQVYDSKFQYNFNLVSSDNVEFVTIGFVARSCIVDMENIYRSGQCVKLCYDTVRNFLDKSSNLKFDFGIKRIEVDK